jgi:hypothetical protein
MSCVMKILSSTASELIAAGSALDDSSETARCVLYSNSAMYGVETTMSHRSFMQSGSSPGAWNDNHKHAASTATEHLSRANTCVGRQDCTVGAACIALMQDESTTYASPNVSA